MKTIKIKTNNIHNIGAVEGMVTEIHVSRHVIYERPEVEPLMFYTLCFKKKFTLLLFAITKSDVDRFQ